MKQEIIQNILRLFENHFGEEAMQISELPSSGSQRIYFRVSSMHNKAIAAYNHDRQENKAFLSFTKSFLEHGFPVPQLFASNEEQSIYLLQDLGDETLFSYLEKHRNADFDNEDIIAFYKEALTTLIRFQTESPAFLNFSHCYPRAAYDKQSMLWDLNYFKYYFLKLADIPFNEQKLEDDFQRFADYLTECRSDYFLYRDFQSRNIMICDNKLYFIDYQGGRRGALPYDVASLLYDAKANIPQHVRENLLGFYIEKLKEKTKTNENEFRKYFYGYVLIRIMQAMGAYGFRGYYEKKTHFLKSIPYAINNLKWLIEHTELPVKLTELYDAFHKIIHSEKLKIFSDNTQKGLTVVIKSFSYKNGYPADTSSHGGGFVFDCRALPNPGRYEEYKSLTGKDQAVIDFLENNSETHQFFENCSALVKQAVENYLQRGFTSLSVSFGCTGGQHRSVYFAEKLSAFLKNTYNINIQLQHLELMK